MFYCFNHIAYSRFSVKSLIRTNVNTIKKLIFSDVYRSVTYIGSLAKLIFTLHVTQCILDVDEVSINEICYLILSKGIARTEGLLSSK